MNEVVLYTTGSCPYCVRAKRLLDRKEVEYTEFRVDGNDVLREEMYQRSNRFTVPQIFIGEYHVGGFDDMYLLDLEGDLDPLLFPPNEQEPQ